MLFSNLFDYLKNEKTFNIVLNCSTDLYEIRDVELLDGTCLLYTSPPCNIVFCPFICRYREQFLRIVIFNDFS